jgi:AcrR family transcriptional regulator
VRRVSTSPTPSLRDQRAIETRGRLVRAAIELVLVHGWRKTTVEQIAARAGVAKGTFFVHFPTKEAIVLALMQKQVAAAITARDEALGSGQSALARLRAATMTLGELAAANIELSRAVLIASLESRDVGQAGDEVFSHVYAKMIEDATEARRQGLVVDVDPETLAGQLMASYLGAALHCTSNPRAKPLPELLGPLVDATLAAASATSPKTANTKPPKKRRAPRPTVKPRR